MSIVGRKATDEYGDTGVITYNYGGRTPVVRVRFDGESMDRITELRRLELEPLQAE